MVHGVSKTQGASGEGWADQEGILCGLILQRRRVWTEECALASSHATFDI